MFLVPRRYLIWLETAGELCATLGNVVSSDLTNVVGCEERARNESDAKNSNFIHLVFIGMQAAVLTIAMP